MKMWWMKKDMNIPQGKIFYYFLRLNFQMYLKCKHPLAWVEPIGLKHWFKPIEKPSKSMVFSFFYVFGVPKDIDC